MYIFAVACYSIYPQDQDLFVAFERVCMHAYAQANVQNQDLR